MWWAIPNAQFKKKWNSLTDLEPKVDTRLYKQSTVLYNEYRKAIAPFVYLMTLAGTSRGLIGEAPWQDNFNTSQFQNGVPRSVVCKSFNLCWCLCVRVSLESFAYWWIISTLVYVDTGLTMRNSWKTEPTDPPHHAEVSKNIIIIIIKSGETRQRSWLRNYVTSRKVVGSNTYEVIGFLNWTNPSSGTMALRSIQPLTEMSTRNLPGCKGRPARKADNLTAICEAIV
jgi:hypothetical protein